MVVVCASSEALQHGVVEHGVIDALEEREKEEEGDSEKPPSQPEAAEEPQVAASPERPRRGWRGDPTSTPALSNAAASTGREARQKSAMRITPGACFNARLERTARKT